MCRIFSLTQEPKKEGVFLIYLRLKYIILKFVNVCQNKIKKTRESDRERCMYIKRRKRAK